MNTHEPQSIPSEKFLIFTEATPALTLALSPGERENRSPLNEFNAKAQSREDAKDREGGGKIQRGPPTAMGATATKPPFSFASLRLCVFALNPCDTDTAEPPSRRHRCRHSKVHGLNSRPNSGG